MTVLSAEYRTKLVAGIVASGAPPQRASIAVDLAAQACDQAVETFLRAVQLAPDALTQIVATEIGVQLLAAQAGKINRSIERLSAKLGGVAADHVHIEVSL